MKEQDSFRHYSTEAIELEPLLEAADLAGELGLDRGRFRASYTHTEYMYGGEAMALCGEDHKKLLHRISRIEGQIRGIRKMVEEDRDCLEVLKQIAAVSGAVRSLGMVILEDHLKGCVSNAIRDKGEDDQLIHQVIEIFNKFSK